MAPCRQTQPQAKAQATGGYVERKAKVPAGVTATAIPKSTPLVSFARALAHKRNWGPAVRLRVHHLTVALSRQQLTTLNARQAKYSGEGSLYSPAATTALSLLLPTKPTPTPLLVRGRGTHSHSVRAQQSSELARIPPLCRLPPLSFLSPGRESAVLAGRPAEGRERHGAIKEEVPGSQAAPLGLLGLRDQAPAAVRNN
jgi:hypothetical protein